MLQPAVQSFSAISDMYKTSNVDWNNTIIYYLVLLLTANVVFCCLSFKIVSVAAAV